MQLLRALSVLSFLPRDVLINDTSPKRLILNSAAIRVVRIRVRIVEEDQALPPYLFHRPTEPSPATVPAQDGRRPCAGALRRFDEWHLLAR